MAQPSGPIPVGVMGLGLIGRRIAQAALASPGLCLVAAVDASPSLAGRSLLEFVPGAPRTLKIDADLGAALGRLKGGVLLHATGSRFPAVLPQLEAAVRAGVHVCSTCEELAFPWLRYEEKADGLDELAQKHQVCVLGTGVNPGFVLDRLVACAGAASGEVRSVHAERLVDLSTRREALQRKAGMGLTEDEFERRAAQGELGHVGLAESAALCAVGLGLDFDEWEDEIEPLLADEDCGGPVPVKKGEVAGLYQKVRGFTEGRQVVELELSLCWGIEGAHDRIVIDADPKVDLTIEGGVPGESATAWAVVNAAPRLTRAEPGLLTVLELPAGR